MKRLYVFTGLFLLLTSFASSWGAADGQPKVPVYTRDNMPFLLAVAMISPNFLDALFTDCKILPEDEGEFLKRHKPEELFERGGWRTVPKEGSEEAEKLAWDVIGLEVPMKLGGFMTEQVIRSLIADLIKKKIDPSKRVNLKFYHPTRQEVATFFLQVTNPGLSDAMCRSIASRLTDAQRWPVQPKKDVAKQILDTAANELVYRLCCAEVHKRSKLASLRSWFPESNMPQKTLSMPQNGENLKNSLKQKIIQTLKSIAKQFVAKCAVDTAYAIAKDTFSGKK